MCDSSSLWLSWTTASSLFSSPASPPVLAFTRLISSAICQRQAAARERKIRRGEGEGSTHEVQTHYDGGDAHRSASSLSHAHPPQSANFPITMTIAAMAHSEVPLRREHLCDSRFQTRTSIPLPYLKSRAKQRTTRPWAARSI